MVALWLILLLGVGCVQERPEESMEPTAVVATVTSLPTAEPIVETKTAVSPTNTPIPQPTMLPTPLIEPTFTPPPAPLVSVGTPHTIGRGQLEEAAFVGEGTAVILAWAYGVSLVDLTATTAELTWAERWWQPTEAPLLALDVNGDETAVAAFLGDGSLRVFDLLTGATQAFPSLRPHAYWGDIAWSPDGNTLAFQAIGPNRADPIYLLNPVSGAVIEVPNSRRNEGTRPYLVWSPDGQWLTLPRLGDACGEFVAVATGERPFAPRPDDGCYDFWALAWSPVGQQLALGRGDAIDLLNLHSGVVQQQFAGSALSFYPLQTGHPLSFSQDGRFLISRGGLTFYNEVVPFTVWDATTGERVVQVGEANVAIDGVGDGVLRLDTVAMGDGFLSLRRDGRLMYIEAGEEAEAIVGHIPVIIPAFSMSLSADGRKVGTAARYGGTAVWDVASGQLELFVPNGRGTPVLSANGQKAAILAWEMGEVILFDVASGAEIGRFAEATGLPRGAAWSPNGRWLAYTNRHLVYIADVETGERVGILEGYPEGAAIVTVIWSPTSDALITAGVLDSNSDIASPIILWQRQVDGQLQELFRTESVRAGYDCCLGPAHFNPSGTRVTMEEMPTFEGKDIVLQVYDLGAQRVVQSYSEYQISSWQSDDLLLTVEAGFDTRQTLWDVVTGEKVLGLAGDTGGHVFAPNGRFLARSSSTGPDFGRALDILFWKSQRRELKLTHGSDILRTAWQGSWLVSLATDGSIRVWPVSVN